jgi:capsular polysaccharide biosynthesis protein
VNLLLIVQKVWRYRLVTTPILGFVLAGAFYVIAIKDPLYEASSSFILVNPPPPPTEEQILRDPELAKTDSDNPYTRYSDQSVVVQVLAARLNSETARREIAKRGADPGYTVASSVEFGLTAPIVEITGTGSSPEAAVATANVVGADVTRELDQMQEERGVADDYKITTQPVVLPQDAQLKASGKLRTLVGLFALCVVLLFVVVSAADALDELRKRRGLRLTGDDAGGAALEPIATRDRDRGEHSPGGPRAGVTPPDAESRSAAGPNGEAEGHPRLVVPRSARAR